MNISILKAENDLTHFLTDLSTIIGYLCDDISRVVDLVADVEELKKAKRQQTTWHKLNNSIITIGRQTRFVSIVCLVISWR